MRVARLVGVVAAIGAIVVLEGAQVAEGGEPADAKTGEVGVAPALDGHENPPGADKSEAGYVNPCVNEGFTYHVSEETGLVMNDVETTGIDISGDVITVDVSPGTGWLPDFSIVVHTDFEVEFVQWRTACAESESSFTYEPGTEQRYWIQRPTFGSVVPTLLEDVYAQLPAPEMVWPNEDREFGWIYVNIDNDIRIQPVETVREEITVSNLVGSVTAWAQGVPDRVVFTPGEPEGAPVTCSYDQVVAPYNFDEATGCWYRYQQSSAVGENNVFVGRTTLYWDISASGAFTVADGESWREEEISVAEIQAVVQAD